MHPASSSLLTPLSSGAVIGTRSTTLGVMAAALLGVAGCGGHAEAEREPVAARQAARGIRFAIELAEGTPGPLYVLLERTDGQPGWVEVTHEGRSIPLRERCEVQDCGSPSGVCGMSIPVVSDLAESRRVERVWDTTTSVIDSVAGCERRVPAPAGAYVARFCYSREADRLGGQIPGMPGDRLVNPICTERQFTLEDTEVVLRL
jgi:hypothetical protein